MGIESFCYAISILCLIDRGLLGNLWGLHAHGFRQHGRQGKRSHHGLSLGRPRLFPHRGDRPLDHFEDQGRKRRLLDLSNSGLAMVADRRDSRSDRSLGCSVGLREDALTRIRIGHHVDYLCGSPDGQRGGQHHQGGQLGFEMAVRLGDCNGRIGRIPDHQTRSQTSEGSTRSRGFPELGLNDKAHESLRRCGIDQEMVGGPLEKISFSFGKGHGIQSLSKESGSRTRPISGVAGFRRFSFLLSLHFKGGTGQRPFGESALWDQSQLSGGRLPQHQTSGTLGKPMAWLDTSRIGTGCWEIGIVSCRRLEWTRGSRCHFAFSFGPFLGFWTAYEAAQREVVSVYPEVGRGASSESVRFWSMELNFYSVRQPMRCACPKWPSSQGSI